MLLLLWGRLPKMVPVDALNPVGILIPDNGRLDSHKRLYTMAVQMFISSWIGHVPFWQWKVKATNFYRGHEVKCKFHVINNTQFIRKWNWFLRKIPIHSWWLIWTFERWDVSNKEMTSKVEASWMSIYCTLIITRALSLARSESQYSLH